MSKITCRGIADNLTDIQFLSADITEIELGKSFFHKSTAKDVFPNSYDRINIVILSGHNKNPEYGNYIVQDAFKECTGLLVNGKFYVHDLSALATCEFGNEFSNPCFYTKNIYLSGNEWSITSLSYIEIGFPLIIQGYSFINCESLIRVYVPDSVNEIGPKAFAGCTSLTRVSLPNNISRIAGDAFEGCTSLVWDTTQYPIIELNGWSVQLVCGYIASATSTTKTVLDLRETNVKGFMPKALKGNDYITEVILNNNITEISPECFSGCSRLEYVTNSENVIKIHDYAFYQCNSMTNFIPSNEVNYIGDYAFSGCSVLQSAMIPNSVKYIGTQAFYGCSGLQYIKISQSVIDKGYNSVFNEDIEEVDTFIVDSNTIPNDLSYYTNIIPLSRNLVIGDSVTDIGTNAFLSYMLPLPRTFNLTIGKSVNRIGEDAFGYAYRSLGQTYNQIIFKGNCPYICVGAFGGQSGDYFEVHAPSNSNGWEKLMSEYIRIEVIKDQPPI